MFVTYITFTEIKGGIISKAYLSKRLQCHKTAIWLDNFFHFVSLQLRPQSILLKAHSNGDVLPLFTCINSHSVLVQNMFPLFAQWFATASVLRQQQSKWNPPKFKVDLFVIVHKKGLYSRGYMQTKDKRVAGMEMYI